MLAVVATAVLCRVSCKHVQQIQASAGTGGAFAAILGDGSVVTRGAAVVGGDSSAVQDQLNSQGLLSKSLLK